jgi:hypothetical protein
MAAVYATKFPSLNEPTGFVTDDLDPMDSLIQTLTIQDGLSGQAQNEPIQSFDYHDSDFLSASYTGPLVNSESVPVLQMNNIPALPDGLSNENAARSGCNVMDRAFDGNPRPIIPLGDDEPIQSFNYDDSDFLFPSYTGPLLDSESAPALQLNNVPAFPEDLSIENTARSECNVMDGAFDGNPRPIVPLGDDEIELRSLPAHQSLAEFESINTVNTAFDLFLMNAIGNASLAHEPEERQVPEIENLAVQKQLKKTRKPYEKTHNPYYCTYPFLTLENFEEIIRLSWTVTIKWV